MYESLENQRVVIIGASSGIGLATAELLSRAGAELILAKSMGFIRNVSWGQNRVNTMYVKLRRNSFLRNQFKVHKQICISLRNNETNAEQNAQLKSKMYLKR